MDKLTINSNFKFDVMKDFLVPNKYDFYIVFSRDYSRNKREDVKPRDTLNSIFNKGTPEIKLMYIKKIEDAEIFGAVRKNKSPKPTNNYTSTTDFPSDYYYVAYNDIDSETADLTHIYFRTSIQALNEPDLQKFNIVTLIYCGHSTDDLSADYTAGTALVSAPALPATTLADYCYYEMFKGCTALKISSDQTETYQYAWRIPTSGTGTAASNWNTSMLSGTGGTFTGDPDIDTTYYVEHHPVPEPSTTYLTFQSDSPFTLRVNDNTKHWDGTLNYSTDLETWSEWDGTTPLISSVDNKLYLRGTENTVITGNSQSYGWVLEGSNIECIGNIENLLDWEAVESGNHPSMEPYCYAYLFRGTTDQPDSNPFTAEGVNARIFAQIKPITQFMTKADPGNVAPDSIPKLQLMIEL
jgi:hypothetical protein